MQTDPAFQQKKTENTYKDAHVNILLTASWLNLQTTKSLKPFQISPQQFNVLSILHGFHPAPATVKVLTERMVDQMSNASRLVEKLKKKGLVEREASDEDRRRVNVSLTPAGLNLLKEASRAFEKTVEKQLNQLKPEDVTCLNNILQQIRG